jgi:hypothetical protein
LSFPKQEGDGDKRCRKKKLKQNVTLTRNFRPAPEEAWRKDVSQPTENVKHARKQR